MASKIGRPGSNPGPGRTSATGSKQNPGNLGRSTSGKRGASMNRDATVAFKRKSINPGPGGTQIP